MHGAYHNGRRLAYSFICFIMGHSEERPKRKEAAHECCRCYPVADFTNRSCWSVFYNWCKKITALTPAKCSGYSLHIQG